MVKIAVNGAKGRVGQAILAALPTFPQAQLTAAYVHGRCAELGKPVHSATAVCYVDSAKMDPDDFDVLIDFSTPESALLAMEKCHRGKKPIVIGVTGFSEEALARIDKAAAAIPVLLAPNMSLGVNLCMRLIQQLSYDLARLAQANVSAEIDILDSHHRHKVDFPSGTALKIGQLIAKQLGLDPEHALVINPQDMPIPRHHQVLGVHSIRAGNTVGEHTVVYTFEGERIEIKHCAFNRNAYASGAIYAALLLKGRQPGMYDMQTVIDAGLKQNG